MLEAFGTAEQERLRRHANKFSKSLLKYVGASLTAIGDDTFRVNLGKGIDIALPSGLQQSYQITFDRRQALIEGRVDYGTFGHPLFDTLIDNCTSESFRGGLAAFRTIVDKEHHGFVGFQFNFLVTFASVRETKRLTPLAVTLDGTVREDLRDLLLDSFDWRNDSKAPDLEFIPDWPSTVEGAREAAEDWLAESLAREVEAMQKRAREERTAEIAKIERYSQYREREGQRKIDHSEGILDRLRNSESPDDRRVIPIWDRTVRNAREHLEQVRRDHQRMLAELERRQIISYSYDLINAAWVEIVAPSPSPLDIDPIPETVVMPSSKVDLLR